MNACRILFEHTSYNVEINNFIHLKKAKRVIYLNQIIVYCVYYIYEGNKHTSKINVFPVQGKNSILHYKGRNIVIVNECEVCCPSEAKAAVTQVAFAVFCFE